MESLKIEVTIKKQEGWLSHIAFWLIFFALFWIALMMFSEQADVRRAHSSSGLLPDNNKENVQNFQKGK